MVTITLTAPAAVPAGDTTVIWPALLTVNEVAALAPNLTAVAPVKLVPLIVTLVPPATSPDGGASELSVGGGGLIANDWLTCAAAKDDQLPA